MNGSGEHRSYNDHSVSDSGHKQVATGFQDVSSRFVFDGTSPFAQQKTGTKQAERSYCKVDESQSARRTFTPFQTVFLAIMLIAVATALAWSKETGIIAGSVLFSGFYLCVVVFRAAVLAEYEHPCLDKRLLSHAPPGKTYVILAALYKEAGQVRNLVRSLDGLLWTQGLKQVYLVCEEDDHETINAVYALGRADIGLFVVPQGLPRTKPRALNFALQQVTGDYLVLYDAEDRPHPNQLLEAANRFAISSPDVSCLQSPLTIDNRKETLLTRFFAVEYDTLFLGILPALARWKTPVPLGGTSNHFKLEDLRAVGGWDSFNVTEDADLGIRLARYGRFCETLYHPTYEEAPATYSAWMRQRTRWIKGWLQTLLVHSRNPATTARQMGLARFFQFHMVLTSVVVSVLVHPFFLVAFIFQMIAFFGGTYGGTYDFAITGISTFNLVAGYLTYGLLAWTVQGSRGKQGDKNIVLLFPVYWLLISIAGWRAIFQLFFKPHHWEKTEHGSLKRQTPDFQGS